MTLLSLRDIVQEGFDYIGDLYLEEIHKHGPFEFRLEIQDEEYPLTFPYKAQKDIGMIVVNELILNSFKSLLGIQILKQFSGSRYDTSRVTEKTGSITVKLGIEDTNYVLSVTDNGEGIKPENLEDIWKEDFSTRGTTGAGLPEVRELAEKYNGRVEVESEVGKTTFTVYLPITQKPE